MIGSFFIAKPIIKFLQAEAGYDEFHAFNVIDPITLYLKVIIFLAVVLISPVIMYQVWAFISPGLHETERKVTLSYIPFAFLLMIVGIVFSYFVLVPFVMNFMKELSGELGITQTVGINQYFTFLFQILIPFGIIFQLPIVLLFMSRLGILDPAKVSENQEVCLFCTFCHRGIHHTA